MSQLFLRNAYLTIIPKKGKGLQIGGDPLNPYRFKFNVEKYDDSGAGGSAQIDVYNLSDSTIGALRADGTQVRFNAGYGKDTPVLAFGNVYEAPLKMSGSDRIVSLEIIETGYVMDNCVIQMNMGANCTNQQAVNFILNQLYALGAVAGKIIPLNPVTTYQKGIHYSGSVRTILARLLKQVGYSFSLSNGTINIGPRDSNVGNVVYVLSPTTGLIDIPTPNIEIGNYSMYNFRSLLNARLNSTSIVKIISKYVKNGFYRVFKASHKGDTFEGDYVTELQAIFVK